MPQRTDSEGNLVQTPPFTTIVKSSTGTITIAGQSGNFQLKVMLPVVALNLLQSIEILANESLAFIAVSVGHKRLDLAGVGQEPNEIFAHTSCKRGVVDRVGADCEPGHRLSPDHTGGATKRESVSGSLNISRVMKSSISFAVPHWSLTSGLLMS